VVEYNTIHDCHTGVRLESGAASSIIQYNDIHDNDFAIRCGSEMGSGNVAHYNDFVDNSGLEWTNKEEVFPNVYVGAVCNVSATLLDARFNWWGDESGPSGGVEDPVTLEIADGSGDSVSSNVRFDPWK